MSKKFLLIGVNQKQTEPKRIKTEASSIGLDYTFAFWRELVFDLRKDDLKIFIGNKRDLREFDVVWMRSAPKLLPKITRPAIARNTLFVSVILTVEYILATTKKVLNSGIAQCSLRNNKLFQYTRLKQNGFPIVPSVVQTALRKGKFFEDYFSMPYIVKTPNGSRGLQVFKIEQKSDLEEIDDRFGHCQLMAQKYMPIHCDYRILILGGKVLGAMKRTASNENFKTNFSLGGRVEPAVLPEFVLDMAIQAARLFQADFCGVDIVEHKGEYYILELNFSPGFEGFEKATGVNVPRSVIEYLIAIN